jgi:hypothetical protein
MCDHIHKLTCGPLSILHAANLIGIALSAEDMVTALSRCENPERQMGIHGNKSVSSWALDIARHFGFARHCELSLDLDYIERIVRNPDLFAVLISWEKMRLPESMDTFTPRYHFAVVKRIVEDGIHGKCVEAESLREEAIHTHILPMADLVPMRVIFHVMII